jgi:hypothetical protein
VGAVREHEEPTVARIPAERLSDDVRSSETPSVETTLRIQRAAGNRAVQRWLASRPLQRKEVADALQVSGATDWTTSDRTGNTERWQAACLTNLSAVDASQYRRIVERRDFYKWFYDYTMARGYMTRWPLAAWVVANGAHQIADMDQTHSFANETIGPICGEENTASGSATDQVVHVRTGKTDRTSVLHHEKITALGGAARAGPVF